MTPWRRGLDGPDRMWSSGSIGWAVWQIQCGRKVRRPCWAKGLWIGGKRGHQWCSQEDLLATDWELAEKVPTMVEDDLRDCIRRTPPQKTPLDLVDQLVSVPCSLLERILKEIETLRVTAGEVTGAG